MRPRDVSDLLGITQWQTAEAGLQVLRIQFPHPRAYPLLHSQPLPQAWVSQGGQAHTVMSHPAHTSSLLGNMHLASVLNVITGGAGPERRNGVSQKVICLTHWASCPVSSELFVSPASDPSLACER